MRRFTLGGVPVRLHPALPLMLALGVMLGGGARIALLALSLALHEAAHALCALWLKVRVVELELMPFGGAARLENAWAMRPGQLAAVALAGPTLNALLAASALALGSRGFISPWAAWVLLLDNAALCLFNLLPALPLDGGRLVFGLLSEPLGAERAARWGVWAGRALAGLMLAGALAGILALGRLHLTLCLCAAFILASGGREILAAGSASLISLVERSGELAGEGTLPLRWLAAGDDTPLRSLIPRMHPRTLHRVAVYDRNMRLAGVVEEEELLRAALEDANAPVGGLL